MIERSGRYFKFSFTVHYQAASNCPTMNARNAKKSLLLQPLRLSVAPDL